MTRKRKATPFSADRALSLVLSSLLVIYFVITILCYSKVELTDDGTTQQSSSPMSILQDVASRHLTAGDIQQLFPIHVDDSQMEDIVHPGYQLLEHQTDWTLPSTTIRVPKFFDDLYGSYYGPYDSVRAYLGNYNDDRIMNITQAKTIGSFFESHETIYASIASYRDPECSETVVDLFARAEFPQRIRLAILDQIADGDTPCQVPVEYKDQVDVFTLDAKYAVGPVFARHLAHRFYRGEYFAMQIDSHVRFTEHWDTDIIQQWKSARNEMAVLSTYLSDIIGSIDQQTHKSLHQGRPIMCVSDYEGNGASKHLRHGQQPEGPPGIHGEPTLHPFWAAGFSFARGHFVIQVPYDQYLPMVFQGEEISIGLRGFTYGYDYYAAERSVCFHMYAVKENKERRQKIPLFWENSKLYRGVGVKAMKRLNTIIGMADFPVSEWPQDDKIRYGLGHVRKAEKFFETFGIHIAEQKVEQHLCRFVGKPMMKEFLPALRADGMGIDYDKINYRFTDPVAMTKH